MAQTVSQSLAAQSAHYAENDRTIDAGPEMVELDCGHEYEENDARLEADFCVKCYHAYHAYLDKTLGR